MIIEELLHSHKQCCLASPSDFLCLNGDNTGSRPYSHFDVKRNVLARPCTIAHVLLTGSKPSYSWQLKMQIIDLKLMFHPFR